MNAVIAEKPADSRFRDSPVSRVPKCLPKHILAPVDFSENSKHGLAWAASYARRFDARLSIVHVVEPTVFAPYEVCLDVWMNEQTRTAKLGIEHLAREFGTGIPDGRISTEVRAGHTVLELCQTAASRGVDLIALSSHGYTGLKRALLGGITDTMVRHAPCPVIVTKTPAPEPASSLAPLRRLLVAVDFSERAEEAIRYAGSLAACGDGTVSLIHVMDTRELEDEFDWNGGDVSEAHTDVRARLGGTLAETLPAHLRGEVYVHCGAPFAQIAAFANLYKPDMVVLAIRGASGLVSFLTAGIAERVVHHASTPVLILPTSQ